MILAEGRPSPQAGFSSPVYAHNVSFTILVRKSQFIEQPEVIEKILTRLNLCSAPA
jgi:hypothetical protein